MDSVQGREVCDTNITDFMGRLYVHFVIHIVHLIILFAQLTEGWLLHRKSYTLCYDLLPFRAENCYTQDCLS